MRAKQVVLLCGVWFVFGCGDSANDHAGDAKQSTAEKITKENTTDNNAEFLSVNPPASTPSLMENTNYWISITQN
ncbi:MAG: hypothetical protein AAF310_04530 [Myxococcota bacterium]